MSIKNVKKNSANLFLSIEMNRRISDLLWKRLTLSSKANYKIFILILNKYYFTLM